MKTYRHRFDFNVGYLIKSPCCECATKADLPGCMDRCEVLDRIRERLRGVVSSSRGFSARESYQISPDMGESD